MIPYAITQAYKNIYIRIGVIFLFFLTILSITLKNRVAILNFKDSLFNGMSYSDPSSWQNKPYGFKENAEASLRLYMSALEDLAELSLDTYNSSDDEVLAKQIKLEDFFSKHLNSTGILYINNLISDLGLFCPRSFINTTSIRSEWNRELRLKRRKLKLQKNNQKNPFDYAVTEQNVDKLKAKLEKIDQNYLKKALEKKPDAYSVMSLRNFIAKGRCVENNIPATYTRALDYLEFKTEKKIYYALTTNDNSGRSNLNPDRLLDKTFAELKDNRFYTFILEHFFNASYSRVRDLDWKISNALQLYENENKSEYFLKYLDSLLAKIRIVNLEERQKLYNEVIRLKNQNKSDLAELLYAKAEASFRVNNIKRAEFYIKEYIKLFRYKKPKNTYRKILRLQLILSSNSVKS